MNLRLRVHREISFLLGPILLGNVLLGQTQEDTETASGNPINDITVELRLRDTSYYVGRPFNFYVEVRGSTEAPEPFLNETDSFQLRSLGSTPSTLRGPARTFTYEAIPLQSGSLTLPSGNVPFPSSSMAFVGPTVEVASPEISPDMNLEVSLSQPQCYVGEPILLTFQWTTRLSLNGIKAVDIRVPILSDPRFRSFPLSATAQESGKNAIGLPVANQRIIASWEEVPGENQPAIRLTFQRVLVAQEPTPLMLLLPPATLFCSYAPPTRDEFKGTRYPSYFNNDFFDQDISGSYERLSTSGEPNAIRILDLPKEGQPNNFSGIVGPFSMALSASPTEVSTREPIQLAFSLSGLPFPHLFELPDLSLQSALTKGFLLQEEPVRRSLKEDGNLVLLQTIRPQTPDLEAIPKLNFSYFDPATASYGFVETPPIPLTVRETRSVTAFDAEFSDGTRLRNEVEPAFRGISHNVLGPALLLPQRPQTWTFHPLGWLGLFGLPPLLYLLFRFLTHTWRRARTDPHFARRRYAFLRLRRRLRQAGQRAEPRELGLIIRSYLFERHHIPPHLSVSRDWSRATKDLSVNPEAADALRDYLLSTETYAYGKHRKEPPHLSRRSLLGLLRHFEKAVLLILSLTLLPFAFPPPLHAASDDGNAQTHQLSPAEQTLFEAQHLFDEARETALVDPIKATRLYRLSAERLETLPAEHGITNGALHYNLGNTYLLAEDLGKAILHYLRAQHYIPQSEELRQALQEARLQQVDTFPQAGPSRVWRALLFWHYALDHEARFLLVGIGSLLLWITLTLRLFLPGMRHPIFLILAALLMMLPGASSLVHRRQTPPSKAVILAAEIVARKGDARIYEPAFTNPLHQGAEVEILEHRDDWIRIRVPDGNQGWIPTEAAEAVFPSTS